jgi:hypothetical protein
MNESPRRQYSATTNAIVLRSHRRVSRLSIPRIARPKDLAHPTFSQEGDDVRRHTETGSRMKRHDERIIRGAKVESAARPT